jgi:hypothetical protein
MMKIKKVKTAGLKGVIVRFSSNFPFELLKLQIFDGGRRAVASV